MDEERQRFEKHFPSAIPGEPIFPKASLDKLDEYLSRIEALEAENARLLVRADELGFHCTGCGHLCGDLERDIAMIRKAGGRSCCPERKMEPLSAALKQEGGE